MNTPKSELRDIISNQRKHLSLWKLLCLFLCVIISALASILQDRIEFNRETVQKNEEFFVESCLLQEKNTALNNALASRDPFVAKLDSETKAIEVSNFSGVLSWSRSNSHGVMTESPHKKEVFIIIDTPPFPQAFSVPEDANGYEPQGVPAREMEKPLVVQR